MKSTRSHSQVIAPFTCGEISSVILATNDLSIYLPFCAKTTLTIPQLEFKVFTHTKKYVVHLKKNEISKKLGEKQNRLQRVCSKKSRGKKPLRADLQTHGARGEQKDTACEQRRLC